MYAEKRFRQAGGGMTNHGDITQIHGGNVEPAWVVIGGSPCQDLSVAGKRAGLEGERSGLFMDQIRVIKEMRWHDRSIGRTGADVRPRWMVWENVPGALSSPGGSRAGEDFRAVLEETARVAEEGITIPRPAGGKWQTAGCIVGDGWSIAWRVLDAQFWGVPSVAVESHLWQILQDNPPEKYYLSAKACQGILRRAEKRGKALPEMLEKALKEQSLL